MAWEMYAHRNEGGPRSRPGPYYEYFGSEWYVKEHLHAHEYGSIVRVRLTEAPGDTPDEMVHWGWMDFGHQGEFYNRPASDEPEMIQPARFLLEMCMPYGLAAEEKAGKGRVIRLLAEEIP